MEDGESREVCDRPLIKGPSREQRVSGRQSDKWTLFPDECRSDGTWVLPVGQRHERSDCLTADEVFDSITASAGVMHTWKLDCTAPPEQSGNSGGSIIGGTSNAPEFELVLELPLEATTGPFMFGMLGWLPGRIGGRRSFTRSSVLASSKPWMLVVSCIMSAFDMLSRSPSRPLERIPRGNAPDGVRPFSCRTHSLSCL